MNPNWLTSYRKNLLRNDAILSIILAVVLTLVAQSLGISPGVDSDVNLMVSTLIGVNAEFASIFIAALAIVAAFVDNERLENARKKLWFPDIWRFLSVTACLFLFGIGFGLAVLYFGPAWWNLPPLTALTILLFIEVYRCVRLLYLLISLIHNELANSGS